VDYGGKQYIKERYRIAKTGEGKLQLRMEGYPLSPMAR